MPTVIFTTWPLLLGMLLLMLGNGVQGTLLGIRGSMEGFTTFELSIVMSSYFAGFLIGSRLVPGMILRVGHVRVFAALGSVVSAVLILYPMLVQWQLWAVMRFVLGIGFSGIYITAESWINNAASNETRGEALSAYTMVQMLGIIAAQGLIAIGDPGGYELFLIPAVLVSFAFLPILLSATQTPTFETTQPLPFRDLFRISPLGCIGILISGGVFSVMFGMAAVWGRLVGFDVGQITLFTAALYIGGAILQFPIGRLSDRSDRRKIMLVLSSLAALVMLFAALVPLPFPLLLVVAAVLGGVTYPMYSLLLAYTNDSMAADQMAATSAGLIFLNGIGAICGPLIAGWLMTSVGPGGFFLFIAVLYAMQALYTLWRMQQSPTRVATGAFRQLAPGLTSVAVGAVLEAAPPISHPDAAPDGDDPTGGKAS